MLHTQAIHEHTIELSPLHTPDATVIWLHGLGADGSDFVPIVPELHLPPQLSVRFIFPHAPFKPVTINNGFIMRAWFDIYGVTIDEKIDRDGIAQSIEAVHALIEKEEMRHIPTERILLAGFSQGAVIALTTAITYPKPLAGVIALSGYLPNASEVLASASSANQSLPVFIAHGTEDNIVPLALGRATATQLTQAGYHTSWHEYTMGHSVCQEEVAAIGQWMGQVL